MEKYINMPIQNKISVLFLCADVLDYPCKELNSYKELRLLGYDNTEEFNFDEIQSEYIRIFLISSTILKCVPYASWWIDGKMCGKSLYKINEFYENCGYKFDIGNMHKPGDHISFMLRFVAILAEENKFEKIKEFSIFLTWLNDFADSLKIATKIKNFQFAVEISLNIINSLKERECKKI